MKHIAASIAALVTLSLSGTVIAGPIEPDDSILIAQFVEDLTWVDQEASRSIVPVQSVSESDKPDLVDLPPMPDPEFAMSAPMMDPTQPPPQIDPPILAGTVKGHPAAGKPLRTLPDALPGDLRLPIGFDSPRVVMPGVLAAECKSFDHQTGRSDIRRFCDDLQSDESINSFPLITIVDDSDFAARTLNNWLWTTFTRSNPATDLSGIGAETISKHWGCRGSVVIDARFKPWQAPPVIEDRETLARVDARAARGGALAKYL